MTSTPPPATSPAPAPAPAPPAPAPVYMSPYGHYPPTPGMGPYAYAYQYPPTPPSLGPGMPPYQYPPAIAYPYNYPPIPPPNKIGELKSNLNEDGKKNLNGTNGVISASVFTDFKDGSFDSTDPRAILNENNNSPTAAISSSTGRVSQHQFLDLQNGTTSTMACTFQFKDPKSNIIRDVHKAYQPQFVKIEEHNFSGEESRSTLFSDDRAPTLHWYYPEDWN
ncbi:unnamed protein product [Fraxinus pennsylvanica]|uniref:Uncharacterized protein n=1 Tax=Fraxinus pennsylvanica TaxID=56036 RepID=A0AAD1ZG72_9LAMI|nr:unnamed protein product [Fraxinus pennsylvanica]